MARSTDNVVFIPASELEMTAEHEPDFEGFKKALDWLGKAVVMSSDAEISEIIRRRLFEWAERAVTSEGKVKLLKEVLETCVDYADWVVEHRQQLPSQFDVDGARETLLATYPLHPAVISVFERKWQALSRFQQTRGILRLLALWVSRAYQEGFKGVHKDSIIGLGILPLDDAMLRFATSEQLGETKLEGAVTTDICGKRDSHATRLDAEATEAIKNARLHRKAITAISFQSNGGQAKADATVPDIRFAVAESGLDIELPEQMFIVTKETAEAYLKDCATPASPTPVLPTTEPTRSVVLPVTPTTTQPLLVPTSASSLAWTGEIPPQKCIVLSKLASASCLKLNPPSRSRPKAASRNKKSRKPNPPSRTRVSR